MNLNDFEEEFFDCESLEAMTEGVIAGRQRGSDLHKVKMKNSIVHKFSLFPM
jgi:hypothetical protein